MNNKLIKIGNVVLIQLEDGTSYQQSVTDEEFVKIASNINDDEWIRSFFNPGYNEYKQKAKEYSDFINSIKSCNILDYDEKIGTITWRGVSPHSMPEDFAKQVLYAYRNNLKTELSAYKNFWILLSLNQSEEVRKNAWWFLNKHGLKISSSGFFIAYRNADSTKQIDNEGNPVFTDHYSHTTKISIGHSVSIDRSRCNEDSNMLCSSGLHLGGALWLEKNYFGDIGLVCLCNPMDIVAIPKEECYGKMRVCKYIPIDYAKYDKYGSIIPYDVEQGFECKYAAQAIYEGIINVENDKYYIKAPVPHNNTLEKIVTDNLLNIAKECILNKNYTINN